MRMPFTLADAVNRGVTRSALRWKVDRGECHRVAQGVYVDGKEPPTDLERAVAMAVATSGVASGLLAGYLYRLDAVDEVVPHVTVPTSCGSERKFVRKLDLPTKSIVRGVPCTTGLQTMLDLAGVLDDLQWEQALESALRKGLVSIAELEASLRLKRVGNGRIRRVLKLRPPNALPTESILETFAVQLIRREPAIPAPSRQVIVRNEHNIFIAKVDLAWPDLGVFLELDGGQHKAQPRYDSTRQTSVIATTGWLVGRFTWEDIVETPVHTLGRIRQLTLRSSESVQWS